MEFGARRFDIHSLRSVLHQRFRRWVRRRIPPARKVVLDRRNIFILPTRQGMAFCFMLLLMFIGAINYEASMAFALVFLLVGMFLLSILYTFRNLAGLRVSAVIEDRVFAGENASVTVILDRRGECVHEALRLGFEGSQRQVADLIDSTQSRVTLYVPTRRRGWFSPGRLTLETVFPFGLCRAWSLVDLRLNCLVYPRPSPCDLEWLMTSRLNSGNIHVTTGNDDFYGLREYLRGDSLKHVAWKNFARGQGLFTKQFASHVEDRLWLDWDMFEGMETEERLSRLCFCVLQLDGAGVDYGLRLPGVEIPPGQGAGHYSHVLETLAAYGLAEQEEA